MKCGRPGADYYGRNLVTWFTHRSLDAFPSLREAGEFHETIVEHEWSEMQDLFRKNRIANGEAPVFRETLTDL